MRASINTASSTVTFAFPLPALIPAAIPPAAEPERTAIESLVTILIDTLGATDAARAPHERTVRERQVADLRARIEARISALFNLSDADVETVRAVPIPS